MTKTRLARNYSTATQDFRHCEACRIKPAFVSLLWQAEAI